MDPIARRRREAKYLVDRARAEAVLASVAGRLGAGVATTPVRSVYFDRLDLHFASQAGLSPDDCLKLRAKAYGPEGGEDEVCWAELKRQRGVVAEKRRFPVLRAQLDLVLRGRCADLSLVSGARPADLEAAREARAAFAAVAGVCGPLTPLVAVRYQRRTLTEPGLWRLTLDDSISYRSAAPPAGSGLAPWPGAGVSEPWSVLELKHCAGELPRWLVEILAPLQRSSFSKFVRAVAMTSQPAQTAQAG